MHRPFSSVVLFFLMFSCVIWTLTDLRIGPRSTDPATGKQPIGRDADLRAPTTGYVDHLHARLRGDTNALFVKQWHRRMSVRCCSPRCRNPKDRHTCLWRGTAKDALYAGKQHALCRRRHDLRSRLPSRACGSSEHDSPTAAGGLWS